MSKYQPFRFKKLPISFLLDVKALIIFAILSTITLIVMILSIGMGEMNIHPLDVIRALFGAGEKMHTVVIQTFRVPRIIIGFIVGASLAISGAIMQGVIRNPLASPDIIGITAGAGAAVVTFLTVFLDVKDNSLTVSMGWLPVVAFIGATVMALLIYGLAWNKGVSPIRLVLVGVGLDAAMHAVITVMMIFGPLILATQEKIWLTGSVYGSTWENVWTLLPWFCFFLPFIFVIARNLNIQELGDDLSKGAGTAVQRQRLILMLVSTALAGGAVAFAGGIGFVGLLAPHLARQLVGSAFGALLPVSGLIGGLIVLLADLIARTALSPLDIPAGVFTASIGAPYFIYLLYKNRNM
ncbi:FecCD family ABC transporter permease [Ammoniphilus resinae]|uniref:Iron complex transport system permease protein n=1 Tax=Ammoniphilus resinae TaxID=861532 RepID=A0ABS4GU66_9BACL|nr:iron ABC transporter permease [Ammoniphilus resinae]MBP1933810.1 iron complex transport system permease protein [Ammoniphilus resinae]